MHYALKKFCIFAKNSKPMKRTLLTLVCALATITLLASLPDEARRQTANNYYAYPYTRLSPPALAPAPEGYEPFHIEHYGRHGSRWHIGQKAYNEPVRMLEIAERNGKLTPRGTELLAQLREIAAASIGRDGELTPLGAQQHRQIARRMVANFPQVFADSAYVNANSSVVIRCILSMDNELQEMLAANPRLQITSDASASTMYYIGRRDLSGVDSVYVVQMRDRGREALREFGKKHHTGTSFIDKIFTDATFAADSIDLPQLFHYLYNIAANAQSLEYSTFPQYAPYDLFTDDELTEYWTYQNARWFLDHGNTKLTGNVMPMLQSSLLRNIILSADTALVTGRNGANLRFGHETILMPLTVLMELDDYGREINDLDSVASQWHNYEIFPMGSNIQMIFYRPVGGEGDILVKVLLNEQERRLPVQPVSGPYYRWTDLRDYYLKKIEGYGR